MKLLCKTCQINVDYSSWKLHQDSKKHQTLLPLKILVTGSIKSHHVDSIHKYFAEFGAIVSKTVTRDENKKVTIEYAFKDVRVHSDIIHQNHIVNNGRPVSIHWYSGASTVLQPNLTKEALEEVIRTDRKLSVLNSIKPAPTFESQTTIFQGSLRQNRNKIERSVATRIESDLMSLLKTKFDKDLKIHFYGSYVTHLSVHESDLGVHIENIKLYVNSEKEALKKLKELLERSATFNNVVIRKAEIPYISAKHITTETDCEVNIRNKLPVRTSELLGYYTTLDLKIKPLMLLIRFWADCCDLLKKHGYYFTTYALYLMVIFFLQQEPYNLPSVVHLQRKASPVVTNKWNCGFRRAVFSSPQLAKATLLELLTGFFEYYNNFDYISYVISPFYGSAVEKHAFLEPYDLPECFAEYVKRNEPFAVTPGICVQDFYELKRNLLPTIPCAVSGKFTELCGASLRLIQSRTKETLLLYNLFIHVYDEAAGPYKFQVEAKGGVDEEKWTESVKNVVFKVLKEIYACPEIKVCTSLANCVFYDCSMKYNVWNERVKSLKLVPDDVGAGISKEVAATKHVIEHHPSLVQWKMVVKLIFKNYEARVEITTSGNESSVNAFHYKHYLRVNLERFLCETADDSPGASDVHNGEVKEESAADQESHDVAAAKEESAWAQEDGEGKEESTSAQGGHIFTANEVSEAETFPFIPNFAFAQEDSTAKEDPFSIPEGPTAKEEFIPAQESLDVPSTTDDDPKQAIFSAIKENAIFSRQIVNLANKLIIPKTELAVIRYTIEEDLQSALSSTWPLNKVHFFGPAVQGGYTQDTILYVYVEYIQQRPGDEPALFKQIKNLLLKSGKFGDFLLTKSSLRCKHVSTKTDFTLSITSKIPVYKSSLIGYYAGFDGKLATFILILKFWARHHKLCCKVGSDFALCLLVIFYLQQPPYTLPSVRILQENVDPELTQNWNYAFSPKESTSVALQNATVPQLLAGFFRFYSDLDFKNVVLAPYLGQTIKRISFIKPYALPEWYTLYSRQTESLNVSSAVCIQDPFEHSTNVSTKVSAEILNQFVALCKSMLEVANTQNGLELNTDEEKDSVVTDTPVENDDVPPDFFDEFANDDFLDGFDIAGTPTTGGSDDLDGFDVRGSDEWPKNDVEDESSKKFRRSRSRSSNGVSNFPSKPLQKNSRCTSPKRCGNRQISPQRDRTVSRSASRSPKRSKTTSRPEKRYGIRSDSPYSPESSKSSNRNSRASRSKSKSPKKGVRPTSKSPRRNGRSASKSPKRSKTESRPPKRYRIRSSSPESSKSSNKNARASSSISKSPNKGVRSTSKSPRRNGRSASKSQKRAKTKSRPQKRYRIRSSSPKSPESSKSSNRNCRASRSKSKSPNRGVRFTSNSPQRNGGSPKRRRKCQSPKKLNSKRRRTSRSPKLRSDPSSKLPKKVSKSAKRRRKSTSKSSSKRCTISISSSRRSSRSKSTSQKRSDKVVRPKSPSASSKRSSRSTSPKRRDTSPIRKRRARTRRHRQSRSRSRGHKGKGSSKRSKRPSRRNFESEEKLLMEVRQKIDGITAPVLVPGFLPSEAAPSTSWNEPKGAPGKATSSTSCKEDNLAQRQLAVEHFLQKKISLSDFLSSAGQREAECTNPEKMQIISRCLDALRLMSFEVMHPFKVRPTTNSMKQSNTARSPLHKNVVKFAFTSSCRKDDGTTAFSEALHTLLTRLNIFKSTKNVHELVDSVAGALLGLEEATERDVMAKILQISLLGPPLKEEWKEVSDVGTQCGKSLCNVGVQVNEDELTGDGLLSYESVQILTSVYLLGRDVGKQLNV